MSYSSSTEDLVLLLESKRKANRGNTTLRKVLIVGGVVAFICLCMAIAVAFHTDTDALPPATPDQPIVNASIILQPTADVDTQATGAVAHSSSSTGADSGTQQTDTATSDNSKVSSSSFTKADNDNTKLLPEQTGAKKIDVKSAADELIPDKLEDRNGGQKQPEQSNYNADTEDADIISLIDAMNIREHLLQLTEKPHIAGTEQEDEDVRIIKGHWEKLGLDHVEVETYHVMLSYPDEKNPNVIELQGKNGEIVHETRIEEEPLTDAERQEGVVQPYNAYSAPGTPLGDLIFVNYATVEDFEHLQSLGLIVAGKIAIAKYGKINRGNKAQNAEHHGAIGLILYSEPTDVAQEGCSSDSVYPHTWWMPPTAVQRGSLYIHGDPQTPGYPSTEQAYRIPDPHDLPRIPVQPVGYGDAVEFLRYMQGDTVIDEWKGALNITYKYGPGFLNRDWKVQMKICTHPVLTKTTDVIGYLYGSEEPDRYVLLGNHHDAWTFGAIDPSSGTATMMEVSRAFMQLKKSGWSPRRTLVFCSWGAEEFGIIGSREYVEKHRSVLADRAVAYLNVDSVMIGNYSFSPHAMPLLHKVVYEAAKLTMDPADHSTSQGDAITVYDTWLKKLPATKDRPLINDMGSGSDFEPFVSHVGVTSLDLVFKDDPATGQISYPLYHTLHDTFEMVESFMDPNFRYHLAIGQMWSEIAKRLCSDVIIPYDVSDYAREINRNIDNLMKNYRLLMIRSHMLKQIAWLREAAKAFTEAADDFMTRIANVDKNNALEVRRYNDQLLLLERAFTDPLGLPGRPLIRHVIYAPSSMDSYAPSVFPGLTDALYELDRAGGGADGDVTGVAKELARLTYIIQTATEAIAAITTAPAS